MRYDRQILCRYTAPERGLIELAAQRAQVSMSELVRSAAVAVAVRVVTAPHQEPDVAAEATLPMTP